jgi:hypothetical protein
MAQMQQPSGHRLMELQQQQQQLQQNTRKRKPTSSGAANSTGTGNTVGPSPPSTPSTHTPGGGLPVASNMNIVQKSSLICGADGTSGLASSSNQMVCAVLFHQRYQFLAISWLCLSNFCY